MTESSLKEGFFSTYYYEIFSEIPKSARTKVLFFIKMLSGFRSRWAIPKWCRLTKLLIN